MSKSRTLHHQGRLAWGGLGLIGIWIASACSASSGGPPNGFGPANGAGTSGGGATQYGGGPNGGLGGTSGSGPVFAGFGNQSFDASVFNTGGVNAGGTGAGGATPLPPLPDASTTPIVIDECPGSLDPAVVQALQQGGGQGSKVLYPYDGTVFPVGLIPPVMQWSGNAADAVYLHMKSALFEYKGCFGPNQALRLPIPVNAWQRAGVQSGGATDPLTVELTVSSGGTVSGPMVQKQYFALGRLKGDVFYNTYTSPQANNNGAVLRLRLGDPSPQVMLTDNGISPLGPCWSCHSLSANGNVLVAQHHQYPGGPYSSASINLVANPNPQPPCGNTTGLIPTPACTTTALIPSTTAEMGLGAVYPDGSKVLTMGSPSDSTGGGLGTFPDGPGNTPGMIGAKATMLLDAQTGQPLTLSGWNVQYAKMPSFSPDGSMVVFNWHEDSNGHSLAVANFDTTTNTMSNVRVIFKDNTLYPGWPWITPDNKEVVFVLGNTQDYVSGYPGRIAPLIASSDLWTVDIATGNARQLFRANGYMTPGGPTYLPQPGRDEHLEFFPTMSPIAEGGYFWVFFTSRRTYGNIVTQSSDQAPTKKIWVTAFNIRTTDIIQDPSNPPFYLPGQEDTAGNIRAFAALEPCHKDGASCEDGVDCCGGHCYQNLCQLPPKPPPPPPPPPGEPPPPPPPPPCSNINEVCRTADDCCKTDDRGLPITPSCISHYCAVIAPPH